MDSYSIYNNSSFLSKEHDKCNECDERRVKECCNKCGEGVCLSISCCQTFPHHNRELYIICKYCITDIERKLRPSSVDTCDLYLLKKKISKRLNANIQKLKETEQALDCEEN